MRNDFQNRIISSLCGGGGRTEAVQFVARQLQKLSEELI